MRDRLAFVACSILLASASVATAAIPITSQPSSVSALPGGATPTVLSSCACDAITGPLSFVYPGALAPHIRTVPASVFMVLRDPDLTIIEASYRFQLDAGAPAGSHTIRLFGPFGSVGTLTLHVGAVAATLVPAQIDLAPGGSATVTLTLDGLTATTASYRVGSADPPGGQLRPVPDPVVISIPPGATRGSATFQLQATGGVLPGTYALRLDEVSGLGLPPALATVRVAAPPVVDAVSPATLPAGSRDLVVRVVGRNFQPGIVAQLGAGSVGTTLGEVRRLAPTLLELTLSVRTDAPLAPVVVELVNPDGARSIPGARLFIAPGDTVAGALAVRVAAVLAPRDGAVVSADDVIYPRGLLATSGNGVVIGAWLFDGQVFDRFVVQSLGGQPVEVTSKVPLPRGLLGEHRVQLAVEQPQRLVSEAVRVVEAPERTSGLALFAPADGAVVSRGAAPRFRWSILPGVDQYEIEFERPLPNLPLRRRTSVPEWTPEPGELAALGGGETSWRVRPLLTGGVPAPESAPRRLIVLPQTVELAWLPLEKPADGGFVLRWQGGAPGVLYRVEWLSPDRASVVFAHLTAREELRLAADALPSDVARVVALGPGGEELGRTPEISLAPAAASAARRGYRFAAGGAVVQLGGVLPAEETTVDTAQPRVGASWSPAVDPSQVSLVVDETDVTALAQVGATSVVYDCLLPLAPGRRVARLTVGATTRVWGFTVVPAGAGAASPSGAATETARDAARPQPATARDWVVSATGSVTGTSHDSGPDSSAAHLTLSANVSTDDGARQTRVNGDLSGSHTFEPDEKTETTNRSWVIDLGLKQESTSEELVVGYAAPEQLRDAQLLTTGLPQGTATVQLGSSIGKAFFASSFDDELGGAVSKGISPEQTTRAAGLELPGAAGRFKLRLVGLDIDQEASPLTDGGDAEIYGAIVSWRGSPAFNLQVEGARSSFDAPTGSAATSRDGNAFALRLFGTRGTFAYAANVRSVEAEFFNPSNAGLTPASSPNRTGADLTLSKGFQRSTLTLALNHVETRSLVDGSQAGANLSWNVRLGTRVTGTFLGAYSQAERDGTGGLPRSDRTDWQAGATLSEALGMVTLTQQATWSEGSDDRDPLAELRVRNLALSAVAMPNARVSLFGLVQATRTEQAPALGDVELLQITLNPTFQLAPGRVALTPTATYGRSEHDFVPGATTNEAYGLAISLTPAGRFAFLSANLGANWSRARGPGLPGDGFAQSYTLALAFRGSRRGQAAAPPSLPPPPSPVPALAWSAGPLPSAFAASFTGSGQ